MADPKASDPKPSARRKRGRETTPEEQRLWERAMEEAKPLARPAPPRVEAGEPAAAETPIPPPEVRAPAAAPPAPARPRPPAPARPPAQARPRVRIGLEPAPAQSLSGLDKRRAQRLRRGQLAIEATLDLHRHTLDQAHQALTRFIAGAQGAGKRCVLIITGKGGIDESPWDEAPRREAPLGVLRREVPRWLSEPGMRPRVVAWHPARRQHGGEGALYVLLRRQRG